jgi:hypothetical protein
LEPFDPATPLSPSSNPMCRATWLDGSGYLYFACSGTITLPQEIPLLAGSSMTFDATGYTVSLPGSGTTRIFNVAATPSLTLRHLTLFGEFDEGGNGDEVGVVPHGAVGDVDDLIPGGGPSREHGRDPGHRLGASMDGAVQVD